MTLTIFALRQSAQPPRLEMPTPQRSDRVSLMQPEAVPSRAVPNDPRVKTKSRLPSSQQAVPEMDADINSLIARFNSLFSQINFPVPQHRELCSKPLDSLLDFPSNSALQGLIELNSLGVPRHYCFLLRLSFILAREHAAQDA